MAVPPLRPTALALVATSLGLLILDVAACGALPRETPASYEIRSTSEPLRRDSSASEYRAVYTPAIEEYRSTWIPDSDERRRKKIDEKYEEANALYGTLADPDAPRPTDRDPAFDYKMAIQDAAFEAGLFRRDMRLLFGSIGVALVMLLAGGGMLWSDGTVGRLGVTSNILAAFPAIIPAFMEPTIGVPFLLLILAIGALSFVVLTVQPGPVHPFIARLEEQLRRLPPDERSRVLRKRILIGIVCFVVGTALSAATIAIPFVTIGFVGLIAYGLLKAGIAVAVRVRLA